MSTGRDNPSHNRFSHFRCEEGVVTNVNRKTYTVRVESRHTAKTVEDIQCLVQYHHFTNGEGFHFLPEVGAICMLAWPSDNTPPFVLGFKGAASVRESPDDAPETSTVDPQGSSTDVSFRSRRPQLNPGDIALTTRDENFLILRRGGVVQLGATPISQRVYIPVLNYIRDFCENYKMDAFGGDVAWTVERQEDDPGDDAPATYIFHMNTAAQDEKATVRVRYMALAEPGESARKAVEMIIAPNNIDRDTGDFSGEVYKLIIDVEGNFTEVVKKDRDVTVEMNDSLTVQGDRSVSVTGTDEITSQGAMKHISRAAHTVGGSQVKLGSESAGQPAVKGTDLVTLLASAVYTVNATSGTATMSPASAQALRQALSTKVFLE